MPLLDPDLRLSCFSSGAASALSSLARARLAEID